jgi:hypothetical protein
LARPWEVQEARQANSYWPEVSEKAKEVDVKPSTIWKFSWNYLMFSLPLHFIWEIVQLPLYTLWSNPDNAAIAYAIVHCTIGDLLIATCALLLGQLTVRLVDPAWNRFSLLSIVAISLGVVYTIFSEWRNTVVLRSWEYSDLMPQVLGIGVSPIAQWILIPALVFTALRKSARKIF